MSKANRKYYRTIFLGTAAMATLVWAAVDQFGIPWQSMLELFYGILVVTAAIIVLAGLSAGLWIWLRKWLRDRDAD